MKKMMLLGMLALAASSVFAQESRQDVSISGEVIAAPMVFGNGVTKTSSIAGGFLVSYRYMLTPRSALELNYGWSHNSQYLNIPTEQYAPIHTRQQEITAAYVYTMNFRNFNPFAEIGIGTMIFTPLRDAGTASHDAKQSTIPGGLAGMGLAYEISPSFDIRAEYRGFFGKTPNFNLDQFRTNRYQWISIPTIGIAYHF